jgi:hypothetical protein
MGEVCARAQHVGALARDAEQFGDLGEAHQMMHAHHPSPKLLTSSTLIGRVVDVAERDDPAECANTRRDLDRKP